MATEIRDANPPFAPTSLEDNPADLILQSSDSVHFHVHWAILSFVSVVFRNMQGFPQPTAGDVASDENATRDGKPIVCLSEPEEVLKRFLLFCYPSTLIPADVASSPLIGVDGVYEAMRKYQVVNGTARIETWLLEPHILNEDPHTVFAIACHYGLEAMAKKAALATLQKPISAGERPPPQYRSISGLQLWELQNFHRTCSDALIALLHSRATAVSSLVFNGLAGGEPPAEYGRVWWGEYGHATGCGSIRTQASIGYTRGARSYYRPARWFVDHVQRCAAAAVGRPVIHEVAKMLTTPPLEPLIQCSTCQHKALEDLEAMAEWMEKSILTIFENNARRVQFT